ncbi:HSP90 family protein [Schaalia sp. 19OD2882]|uniref:HSP90 family protein n=1 Tax=Schaalia sp. 19OD2882 TaxID=2794089 RepID=UPI001C1EBA20|nr:HSP90 family protein [Schaalia sp. 19OD2882]QWW19281.1 HSP90 family protein [Schaalia sp. 19OD2882]
MDATFRVDLRGMVELLSRHLYSGPRVYVRELVQNAHDAILARRALDPSAPARVDIRITDDRLTCTDSGIGLTFNQAATFLATIGSSSKRDELGMARGDFLGQFGIGLLSCFMVSDTITVHSRSATTPNAPTVEWTGRVDGSYAVRTLGPGDEGALPSPGTRVSLAPRPHEEWTRPATVRALVDEFAELLPLDLRVEAGGETTLHCRTTPVWELSHHERVLWCEQHLSFTPLDVIDLDVPVAGLKGVAFVADSVQTAGRPHDTAHVKGMLISRGGARLAPMWCYFTRVVAGAEHLRPTASREQLVEDDLMDLVRDQVGSTVLDWLARLSRVAPGRFRAFLASHASALLQVALEDASTLEVVARTYLFDTTAGGMTLEDIASWGSTVRWTRTSDQFRALAEVARAQRILLVDAGHVNEEPVLQAWWRAGGQDRHSLDLALVDPEEILATFGQCTPAELAEASDLLFLAEEAIPPQECRIVLRRFEPGTMPAVHMPDPDLASRLADRSSRAAASGVWEDVLGVSDPFARDRSPVLVLNLNSAVVARLVRSEAPAQTRTTVLRGLYVQALLAGRQPLGAKERVWAAQVMGTLLDSALS